ncbi:hypothetical protein BegalDRAFT_1557 [Beggiatoa alba B18LD]|uniref:Lipoprotein n=1 Tax=Beggiatoa alba B18LD TaxID=395493 RepID=I3CFP5_9GAMM|nr:hypothetical protein [Beggiatoa alba]EIJ42438.1 hypothetical protein BegalDRAFT_1557 [Beggiatoa alba B18LD]
MTKAIFGVLCLLSLLTACSRAIYGVPAEQWEQMSETERQVTIDRFERQEAINAQTRAQAEATRKAVEKARAEAKEFERQCIESKEQTEEECRKLTRTRFGRIF